MTHTRLYATLSAWCISCMAVFGQTHTVSSPDGRIAAEIGTDGKLSYSITYDGKTIVERKVGDMPINSQNIYYSNIHGLPM